MTVRATVDRRRRAPDRSRILEVAADLFDRYGYRSVTMAALAEELGITKPTLYAHMPSKAAIVKAIVDDWIDRCDEVLRRASLSSTSEDWLRVFLTGWTRIATDSAPSARFFEQASREVPAETALHYRRWSAHAHHTVASCIRQGQLTGEFRNDVDATVAAFVLFSTVNWTARWYRADGTLTPEKLAEEYWALHGRSLLPDPR